MIDAAAVPQRSEIPMSDRWDLSSLFEDEASWEQGLKAYDSMTPRIAALKGTLVSSREAFIAALEFYRDFGVLDERLAYYASLRQSEDEGDDASRGRYSRYEAASTRAKAAWAWFVPEFQALPDAFIGPLPEGPALRRVRGLPPEVPPLQAPYPLRKGGAAPCPPGGIRGRRAGRFLGPDQCRPGFRRRSRLPRARVP